MIKPHFSGFYTTKEISKRLKVSDVTLCNLRKAGKIDFIRVGNSVRYPQHVYDGIMQLDAINKSIL
jgi:excisionase family DNA binding protein